MNSFITFVGHGTGGIVIKSVRFFPLLMPQ